MEPLAGDIIHDVVDELPLVEAVDEAGERPQIERRSADAQEVVLDSPQLGEDGPHHLAPRGQVDAEERLHRVVPGDVVHDGADVVHAADGAHVLVVVVVLGELLEAAVQVADVRVRPHHPLAVELKHDPHRGVRGRMLGTEVQDPAVGGVDVIVEVLGGLDVDVEALVGLQRVGHALFRRRRPAARGPDTDCDRFHKPQEYTSLPRERWPG